MSYKSLDKRYEDWRYDSDTDMSLDEMPCSSVCVHMSWVKTFSNWVDSLILSYIFLLTSLMFEISLIALLMVSWTKDSCNSIRVSLEILNSLSSPQ